MTIKESEIKNSKVHALVYINSCFLFGNGCLYPLKNCSKCSYTRYYVVFHGSLDWGLKMCILILLISSKLDLKRVYTTKKNPINRRFVTCFRDVAIHIIAVSRTLHSSNHNAFVVKKYRKWSFWELSNRFWRCNIVLSRRPPLYVYTSELW